ncbi:hypothetical protein VTO73DRAFT_429 [Trametes versicolor]
MCDRTCHLQLTAPPNAAPFGAHIVPSGSSALLVSSRDALLHSRIQAAACAAGPRPPGPTPGIGQPANYDSIRRAGACSHRIPGLSGSTGEVHTEYHDLLILASGILAKRHNV